MDAEVITAGNALRRSNQHDWKSTKGKPTVEKCFCQP